MPRIRRENESGLNKAFVDRRLDDNFQLRYPGAFSATDIYATINLPGQSPRVLGSLVAISLSTHRDTFPVTSMPYVDPRGFTQGHRTTAGTLIFHTIDRNAFFYINRNGQSEPNELVKHYSIRGRGHFGPPHPDTLPLFDIHINYVNQEGMLSFEAVYGVRLLDFGKTVSLENLHPAESYSYMALSYDPMRVILSGDREERKFMLDRLPNREPQRLKRAEDTNFNQRFQPLIDEIARDIVP